MYTIFDQEGSFVSHHYSKPKDIPQGSFITDQLWPQPIYTPKYDFGTKTIIEGMSLENVLKHKKGVQIEHSKQQALDKIESLTVEVEGFIFSATEKSQLRMLLAISAAKTSGLTETGWILKDDDSPTLVTLAQLEQAQSLAIQALGAIIVGNTGTGTGDGNG